MNEGSFGTRIFRSERTRNSFKLPTHIPVYGMYDHTSILRSGLVQMRLHSLLHIHTGCTIAKVSVRTVPIILLQHEYVQCNTHVQYTFAYVAILKAMEIYMCYVGNLLLVRLGFTRKHMYTEVEHLDSSQTVTQYNLLNCTVSFLLLKYIRYVPNYSKLLSILGEEMNVPRI